MKIEEKGVDEKLEKKYSRVKGVSKKYPNGRGWVQIGGEVLTIVDFLGKSTFLVKFKDSPVFKSTDKNIKNGSVRSKNIPMVCGIGYVGYGNYVTKIKGCRTPAYEVWRGIIRRCYDTTCDSYPKWGGSSIDVAVEWHNFQNFALWFYTERSKLPEDIPTKYSVDKDLKGGKCYSEENCTLLPYKLNSFIQNCAFSDDMGYVKNSSNPCNKITTTVSLLGKQIYIGLHETQEDSDRGYNIAKNYVNRKMATEFLAIGLITKETANLITQPVNDYTLDDEQALFKRRPTLKGRIDGLFANKSNLLERCKYKISSEIYKESV